MADWLSTVLPAACPANNGLALARVGSAKLVGRSGFELTSPAFRAGGELDPSFTAEEEDAVAPPLEWTAPPPGTQELAVIVEDASSADAKCHWLVWGLAGQRGKLLEGEAPPRTGKNAQGNSEWLLPSLPEGIAPHTYVFQLFALDIPLTLMPGATREQLLGAMDGHVVAAAALTATYRPSEGDDWDEDDDDFE
ncbi:YbhB/YbcL family Raf kinase inhibitor-like protein [Parerythrobacter aurantius]|uniref:YbhB/YbcL family Raf kinase inhibitor-like protein n=1 Tax=Parerythrobacter aurantius TaxID=3127706 RepID=UPI0032556733